MIPSVSLLNSPEPMSGSVSAPGHAPHCCDYFLRSSVFLHCCVWFLASSVFLLFSSTTVVLYEFFFHILPECKNVSRVLDGSGPCPKAKGGNGRRVVCASDGTFTLYKTDSRDKNYKKIGLKIVCVNKLFPSHSSTPSDSSEFSFPYFLLKPSESRDVNLKYWYWIIDTLGDVQ